MVRNVNYNDVVEPQSIARETLVLAGAEKCRGRIQNPRIVRGLHRASAGAADRSFRA